MLAKKKTFIPMLLGEVIISHEHQPATWCQVTEDMHSPACRWSARRSCSACSGGKNRGKPQENHQRTIGKAYENGFPNVILWDLPSGKFKSSLLENGPVEMVSFPIFIGWCFSIVLCMFNRGHLGNLEDLMGQKVHRTTVTTNFGGASPTPKLERRHFE